MNGKRFALVLVLFAALMPQNGAAAANSYSVVVTYKQTPQSDLQKWTIKCNPAAGTMPKAKTVCKKLLKIANPFAPADPDQMCTEIYGGDDIATVKGTWKGKKISVKYSKINGCEIARWDLLKFLLTGGK